MNESAYEREYRRDRQARLNNRSPREVLNDAAPDLLAALITFVELSPCSNGCDPDDMTCATSAARMAIAKATGEQS